MTAIFPALPGIGIAVKRTPVFSTLVQTSISGKETRAAFQSIPRWKYSIPLNFARMTGFSPNTATNEMATILSSFMTAMGQLNYFDFTDPYSNMQLGITPIAAGTGLAGQTTQLLDIEGYPIYDLNGTPSLYVNGTLKTVTTDYTVSNGLVTWVTNPGNGLAITWAGGYYRRCRFDMDEFELEQIVNLCWGNGTIKLISLK